MLNAGRRAWAIVLVLVAASSVAAGQASGVVVDVERGAAYVMSPGGLEAVDVASGRTAWSSTEAARPIASHAGRLLAQASVADPGKLRLLILDAERGRILRDATLDLPPGAEARIEDAPGSLFRIEVGQAGPRVDLRWTSERRRLQGVMPGEDDPGAVERFAGRVDVDLATSAVQARQEAGPDASRVPLPAAIALEADAGTFRERPRPMGELFVATQEVGPGGGLVLRRWDAQGAPLPALPLRAGMALQLASEDGAFVLLSRRLPGAPAAESHLWTILSLQTGVSVAELRARTAAARFDISRGRLLYVEAAGGERDGSGWTARPSSLRAREAAGGLAAWSRRVRDTAYRGRWVP